MTVRLRGHHLLCLLTYKGEGYSSAFIANFDALIERLKKGETIELLEGPDEICAVLINEDPCAHCLETRVLERDSKALHALEQAQLIDKKPFTVTKEWLAQMRAAFLTGNIREACETCEWQDLCNTVVANDFVDTRLKI